jgi:hypothetical protein
MPSISANWLLASTLTLLLATSCTCDNVARRMLDHVAVETVIANVNTVLCPTSIQPPVLLRGALHFSALAYATVTNTEMSYIGGQVGVSPGSAVVLGGGIDYSQANYKNAPIANPAGASPSGRASAFDSAIAKADIGTAYLEAALRVAGVVGISTLDIGGNPSIYTPGLYKTTGALEVKTGDLTLHGRGVYIFNIEETFEVSENRRIILEAGARACDVYWRVGSSATFMDNSEVKGTVMAYAAINVLGGVHVEGRLFALNEAVTLIENVLQFPINPCYYVNQLECTGANVDTAWEDTDEGDKCDFQAL